MHIYTTVLPLTGERPVAPLPCAASQPPSEPCRLHGTQTPLCSVLTRWHGDKAGRDCEQAGLCPGEQMDFDSLRNPLKVQGWASPQKNWPKSTGFALPTQLLLALRCPFGKCGCGPARPLLRHAGHLVSKKHLGESPRKEGEKEPLCQPGIVIPRGRGAHKSLLGTRPGETLPLSL